MIDKSSFEIPNKVLTVVEFLLASDLPGVTFFLEGYVNGRENGYCLNHPYTNSRVCFSRNRNSDEIVIYFGAREDFRDGNIITEVAYNKKQRVYFKNNEERTAAEFIVRFFEKQIVLLEI